MHTCMHVYTHIRVRVRERCRVANANLNTDMKDTDMTNFLAKYYEPKDTYIDIKVNNPRSPLIYTVRLDTEAVGDLCQILGAYLRYSDTNDSAEKLVKDIMQAIRLADREDDE